MVGWRGADEHKCCYDGKKVDRESAELNSTIQVNANAVRTERRPDVTFAAGQATFLRPSSGLLEFASRRGYHQGRIWVTVEGHSTQDRLVQKWHLHAHVHF